MTGGAVPCRCVCARVCCCVTSCCDPRACRLPARGEADGQGARGKGIDCRGVGCVAVGGRNGRWRCVVRPQRGGRRRGEHIDGSVLCEGRGAPARRLGRSGGACLPLSRAVCCRDVALYQSQLKDAIVHVEIVVRTDGVFVSRFHVCVDARSCIVLHFSAHIWEAYRRYMRTAPHTKHHVARLGMLSEAHTCTSLSCSRTHRDRPSRGETATAASSTSPSLLPCAAPRACHRLPSPHRARRPHLKSRGKRPNSSASS